MSILDPNKPSIILERVAAVGIVWVFAMMSFVLVLPYAANYIGLELSDADRATVNTIVTAINNAFVWVLGFLYGQSVGSRAKDQAINTLANTTATAQAAATEGGKP